MNRSFSIPEGESVAYVPRGGYVPTVGYVSSFDDLTHDIELRVNVWLDIESTWVNRTYFQCDTADSDEMPEFGDWFVEFLDLAIIVYPNTPTGIFHNFLQSPSHGVHLHVKCLEEGRYYETLREAQRKVTKEMKDRRDQFVKVLEDRPTVRNYLRGEAMSRMRSMAYRNSERRRK